MSDSKLLAFRKREEDSPLEKYLSIESDARLARFTSAGSLLGLAFASWALTTTFVIPTDLGGGVECMDCGGWGTPPKIIVKPPPNYHGPIHPPKVVKHNVRPGQEGRQASKPKSAHPTEKNGWLGQNIVTSKSGRNDLGAYDILGHAMRHLDMSKLDELPVLKRTAHSGIGGRRVPESHEFNLEYYEDGTGGGGGTNGVPVLPNLPKLEPVGPTHPPKVSNISSLDYAQESNARSTADILAVIRSHSPGLRHIYNGYLKQRPGMAGKIQLRFAIAPSGDIVELEIASSTTSAPDFDAAIAAQVKSWRFDAVKAAGNDRVTVPFTFSE